MEKMSIEDLLGIDPNSIPNTVILAEPTQLREPDQITKDIVTFLHTKFLLGSYPSVTKLFDRFPLDETDSEAVFTEVNKVLEKRGLPPFHVNFKKSKTLDPKFVAGCGVLSDFSNKKSVAQKLKSVGLTTAQWNNLLKIKLHREYWEKITADLVDFGAYHEGKLALARNVAEGDLPSIKYLNEMSGKFTAQSGQMDSRMIISLMSGVLDIISRHVDGDTARAVADELEFMAVQQLGITS